MYIRWDGVYIRSVLERARRGNGGKWERALRTDVHSLRVERGNRKQQDPPESSKAFLYIPMVGKYKPKVRERDPPPTVAGPFSALVRPAVLACGLIRPERRRDEFVRSCTTPGSAHLWDQWCQRRVRFQLCGFTARFRGSITFTQKQSGNQISFF
jgi:hypothetical protein